MPIASFIDHAFILLTDFIFDRRLQPVPSEQRLKQCKIISHRGEHRHAGVTENTLAAFERAAAAGLWGVELDVRWTRDLVPVVAHDPDLRRIYGPTDSIADLSRQSVTQLAPEIPSLNEVVTRFGGRLHLMIEIKNNSWPDPARQSRSLKEHLGGLQPATDYHLMALQPRNLLRLQGFAPAAMVAIANYRPYQYSRWITRHNWGGLCAHYAMMPRPLIRKQQALGHRIGTAYPASRNCLFREINRGVDWIFSNNAAMLQRIIDQATSRE